MSHAHAGGIARANLQPVGAADLDHRRAGPRDDVGRRTSNIGTPPTPLPTLAWIGMLASSVQAFTKVTARATFQGADLRVLVLTTGPKIAAPAFSTSFICW